MLRKVFCGVTWLLVSLLVAHSSAVPDNAPAGWQTGAPREEIKPAFSFDVKGGLDGKGSFIIRTDSREGLHGFWSKVFPVNGGQHYRFNAARKIENVTSPRRSVVARVLWQNDAGKS